MTAAQSIRRAALSWPLGTPSYVECLIILAYLGNSESTKDETTIRTFWLLVAEELDGGIGDRMRNTFDAIYHRSKGNH